MPASLTPFPATRSRYTLGEYKDRVRRDVALGSSSFLTATDLVDYGNEAQDLFALETRWYRISYAVSSVSGTAEYDIPTGVSGRVIAIEEVWWDDLPLAPVTISWLEGFEGNWRGNSGRPSHYTLRGNTSFRLWPTPSQTTVDVIDVYASALPPVIASDEDYFYVPYGFDHALVRYGVWRASVKDAHGEGSRRLRDAKMEWEEALDRGKRKVAEVFEREVTHLGEDAMTPGLRVGGYVPWFTSIEAPP